MAEAKLFHRQADIPRSRRLDPDLIRFPVDRRGIPGAISSKTPDQKGFSATTVRFAGMIARQTSR
jgi:hypothetical protein